MSEVIEVGHRRLERAIGFAEHNVNLIFAESRRRQKNTLGILLEFNHYVRTRDDAWTRAAQLFRLTLADMSGSFPNMRCLQSSDRCPPKSLEIVLSDYAS